MPGIRPLACALFASRCVLYIAIVSSIFDTAKIYWVDQVEMSNEGSAYSNSPHRSLLQSSNSSTIFDETEQTKQTFRPWKPLTLRTPLLLSVSVVTISLIILLELLARLSQRNGGIVFADEKFSSLADFTYLYLPVMISVSYSMLWAWIDLDAKRLEPYFQMSKPGGAKGRDSLFLHYPFDFVAFAPIKAVKRRCVGFNDIKNIADN